MPLPFLTADLPGIGGSLRARPQDCEDFAVEELAAYLPSGSGEHVMALVEKRDLTTPFAAAQLARALGVAARDVGHAGMKDRRAVTRQWMSFPPPVTPEQVLAAAATALEGAPAGDNAAGPAWLRVLDVARHPHKLRTGHLRGNRFTLVVRDVAPGAAAAARAILAALASPPGAPNWYGEQRFGRAGDNAAAGLALVRKQRRFERDPRKNRLLLSALQSQLFNDWLERRLNDGLYRQVLEGDVLRKVGGGAFVCTDPAVDQERLRAGELVPTGPMFGVDMRGPSPGSPAAAREAEVLAASGLTLAELAPLRKLAPGARRDAAVAIADWSVAEREDGALELAFTLPAGAYATAVMRELQKLPEPAAPQTRGGADGEASASEDSSDAGEPGVAEASEVAARGAAGPEKPEEQPWT